MAKIRPLSGFPEWLPEQRLVEQRVLDEIRARFESYGFAPVETRSVEPLEQLTSKGATDKEIYVLRRIHAGEGDPDTGFGLHFDLTVPFARYVMQHRGELAYPFKRYQIQRVWRGERPQVGRYREFTQADIDVVDLDSLSLSFDAEMPRLLAETLAALPLPPVVTGINNRKVLEGLYRGIGIEEVTPVLRIADKLAKIGADNVRRLLGEECGLSVTQADTCLAAAQIRSTDTSFVAAVRALGVTHELLDEGLDELAFVMGELADLPAGSVVADLSIARGLDYYTGTVYEAVMPSRPELGTVCAGGRYDNLVGGSGNVRLPGVGISIGVTRMLAPILAKKQLAASRSVPTCVLVTLPADEARGVARDVTRSLRARGVPTETYHAPAKFGKQLKYAQKRGIPFVWFVPTDAAAPHEVKDLRSGEQIVADPAVWSPPDADLRPSIVRSGAG